MAQDELAVKSDSAVEFEIANQLSGTPLPKDTFLSLFLKGLLLRLRGSSGVGAVSLTELLCGDHTLLVATCALQGGAGGRKTLEEVGSAFDPE
jgi:hypothetical protein